MLQLCKETHFLVSIFLSKEILEYMHFFCIFSLFTLLQKKIEILCDIFKRKKKNLEGSPVQTESVIYVSILCVQQVVMSANNLLSLHQRKKKKIKVGEKPSFFPKGS